MLLIVQKAEDRRQKAEGVRHHVTRYALRVTQELHSTIGMTLVELLIGSALLVGGGGALLLGIQYSLAQSGYFNQVQVAMNAAQGRLEELSSLPFDSLWEDGSAGGTFGAARLPFPANPPYPRLLDHPAAGTPFANMNGQLAIQIRRVPPGNNPVTPNLLDIHVAACWQFQGRRIGERQNNDPVPAWDDSTVACADGTADGSTNWWVDSPVMVSARVARRD